MKQVTLELLGRHLVELRETVEPRTAILMWIDGTLQGIAAENRALLRREARQNRDLEKLREQGQSWKRRLHRRRGRGLVQVDRT